MTSQGQFGHFFSMTRLKSSKPYLIFLLMFLTSFKLKLEQYGQTMVQNLENSNCQKIILQWELFIRKQSHTHHNKMVEWKGNNKCYKLQELFCHNLVYQSDFGDMQY